VQRLVRAKNHSQRTAAWQLGELVAQRAPCPWDLFDGVVPVPLHWTRWWRRGFNQAEIMARAVCMHHALPLFLPLTRTKQTKFQAEIGGVAPRLDNVADAFAFVNEQQKLLCSGRSLLLVDDVVTSGATVVALARLLYRAGAKRVSVVVSARG